MSELTSIYSSPNELAIPIEKDYPVDTNQKRKAYDDKYPSPPQKRHRVQYEFRDIDIFPPKNTLLLPSPISPVKATLVPCHQVNNRTIALPKKRKEEKTEPVKPTQVTSDCGTRLWEIIKSLGKGGCGEVYLAQEITSEISKYVAVKIIRERKQFVAELGTMRALNSHICGRGNKSAYEGQTPKLLASSKKDKAIVMEYLSDSLSHKFEAARFHFSLKTILMLAMNIMTLARDFSLKTGKVHVDIKPSNICCSADGRELYLIDFGYATSPVVKLPGQTGTPLFMSHHLQTIGATYPSVQDDCESLGYMLMFLIGGGKKGLPWGTFRTHKDIAAAKNDEAINEFFQCLVGTEYEPIIPSLSNFIFVSRNRSLPFTWEDHHMLYRNFESTLNFCGWVHDKYYDWCEPDLNSQSTLITMETMTKGKKYKFE